MQPLGLSARWEIGHRHLGCLVPVASPGPPNWTCGGRQIFRVFIKMGCNFCMRSRLAAATAFATRTLSANAAAASASRAASSSTMCALAASRSSRSCFVPGDAPDYQCVGESFRKFD
jgi:hypothetical protein